MKKIQIINFLFYVAIFGLLITISCKEEEINVAPGKVTLTSPSNIATDVALDAKLSWQAATDPDGDALLYDVYFGTDTTPSTTVSTGQAGTSYTPSLLANTTYYWKVVVKDTKGNTSQSASWSFSTLNNGPETVTLTAPGNEATDIALDIELTWQAATDPDGDAVVYDVYLGEDPTPATIVSTGQSTTTYNPALTANTTYYWQVVAKDANDGSSQSAIWSFSTLNNPPATTMLIAPIDASTGVAQESKLTWHTTTDPDGDAVVYDVYFGEEANPGTIVSVNQADTTYTPTLVSGTTYYWKIVAKDPNGGTSESAIWSFRVLLKVGDFYKGGVVFYLDESEIHGLVCAITDQNPAVYGGWGCGFLEINGADGTAIGTGLQNTLDILNDCGEKDIAADICIKLTLNGYSDWFLPSIDELRQMFANKGKINTTALAKGGTIFIKSYYYSSTEESASRAYAVSFGSGGTFMVGKSNLNYMVRAVRAF